MCSDHKENLEFTQLSDRARVYRMNVYKAVDALNAEDGSLT